MDKWITKEDFQQQVEKQKEEEETTPWGDLEEEKIYLIDKSKNSKASSTVSAFFYI